MLGTLHLEVAKYTSGGFEIEAGAPFAIWIDANVRVMGKKQILRSKSGQPKILADNQGSIPRLSGRQPEKNP